MHLYVHVPFCARRCSYCDFAIAVRAAVPSERFADLVIGEWRGLLSHSAWSASDGVDTIYFGGGTPSRLQPAALGRIVNAVRSDRGLAPGAEVTLEANPDDVTAERVARWRTAGVNRVSLGVQSFDPGVLRWMHRTHAAAQAERAVELLRRGGIERLSLDLIFGLPAALGRDWDADLEQALALGAGHLSLYGLTVEPHTPLAHWTLRGEATPADERSYAAEFLAAHERLAAAGYEHYEVSNYARPGERAVHNSAYWQRRPYLGLGPSAHSGVGRDRWWNVREWAAYERAACGGEALVAGHERLDDEARRLESLYLGLRTIDGVPAAEVADAERWIAAGWAERAGDRLRLTAEGWLRLDSLVAAAA